MEKKTYIKCDLIIVDIQSATTVLTSSATVYREQTTEAEQLSRQSSFDLWDNEVFDLWDNEDEEY